MTGPPMTRVEIIVRCPCSEVWHTRPARRITTGLVLVLCAHEDNRDGQPAWQVVQELSGLGVGGLIGDEEAAAAFAYRIGSLGIDWTRSALDLADDPTVVNAVAVARAGQLFDYSTKSAPRDVVEACS